MLILPLSLVEMLLIELCTDSKLRMCTNLSQALVVVFAPSSHPKETELTQ